MRVLAVDYGQKRIGLALSDALGILASPLEVHEYKSQEQACIYIATLAKRKGANEIVVGLPLDMNGDRGPQAEVALQFTEALQKLVDMPVISWDERLTTAEAQRAMLDADVSRAGRRSRADMVAAAILLQAYLDTKRNREQSQS